MPAYTVMRNNFSSGEIGPHVKGRTDIPAYANGCLRLENMLITKLGTLRRRPGTYYLGAAAGACRLIPWVLPDGTSLIIELSNLQARYLTMAGAFLADIDTTPWPIADLPALRVANVKGVLYFTHASYAPRTMTYSAGSVTFATPTFTGDFTFSSSGDYPANVAFYAGRLWFQGTTNSPRSIWASDAMSPVDNTDRFLIFDVFPSPTPDMAIHIKETAMGAKPLQWLEPLNGLVAGGERAVWQQSGTSTVPGGFDMRICSANGAGPVQGRAFGSFLVYVGADSKSLHALAYSQDAGGYGSTELSFASRNLIASGIKEFDIEQAPDPTIWTVTTDGQLLSYHLDQAAGVAGFATHPITGATIESVAVAREGLVDRVYLVLNRSGTRSIEFIDPGEYTTIGPAADTETPGGMHYVDSGIYHKEAAPATTFSGLAHLEGQTVDALADGAVMPAAVVASGSVTYSRAVTRIHIGMPMTSLVQPTSPEIPTNGSGQGKKRRIEKMRIRLVDSYGGKFGRLETELKTLPDFKYGVTAYGTAPVLYSGDKEASFPGVFEDDLLALIVQGEPLPFHLLAIISTIAIGET